MVLYIPDNAGFLPSTVSPKVSYLIFGLPIESKHSCVEHEFFGGGTRAVPHLRDENQRKVSGCFRLNPIPWMLLDLGDVYHSIGLFTESKKVTTHPDIAHPRQSPYPTMKGFPLQPIGKGLGVCSKGVLKQP